MTLEKLAAMVADGFNFMKSEMDERFARVDERFAQIDERFAQIDIRLFAITNRLDDLSLNRVTRDELAATNARVSRVERHLGLA